MMALRLMCVVETFFSFSRGIVDFFVFLPLHTPVLEPDFNLPLRQTQCFGDLASSRTA